MPQCSVPTCRNSGVHLFPKDPVLRKKWEKAIRRKKSATDYLRLCRDHFQESDYVGISAYTGRPQIIRYLKKGVIPSIFPWTQKSNILASSHAANEEEKTSHRDGTEVKDQNPNPFTKVLHEKMIQKSDPKSVNNPSLRRRKFKMFPKDVNMKEKWIRNMRRGEWTPTKFTRLCSLHFEANCYREIPDKNILHSNAVPTIFKNQPDGMTLLPWKMGRPLVRDATCVDTPAPSHLPSTVISAGASAAAAETVKRRKYANLVCNYVLEPFGVETVGSWGPSACCLYKEIAKRLIDSIHDRKAGLFHAQRIIISILRENPASLLGIFPVDSDAEEYYDA